MPLAVGFQRSVTGSFVRSPVESRNRPPPPGIIDPPVGVSLYVVPLFLALGDDSRFTYEYQNVGIGNRAGVDAWNEDAELWTSKARTARLRWDAALLGRGQNDIRTVPDQRFPGFEYVEASNMFLRTGISWLEMSELLRRLLEPPGIPIRPEALGTVRVLFYGRLGDQASDLAIDLYNTMVTLIEDEVRNFSLEVRSRGIPFEVLDRSAFIRRWLRDAAEMTRIVG